MYHPAAHLGAKSGWWGGGASEDHEHEQRRSEASKKNSEEIADLNKRLVQVVTLTEKLSGDVSKVKDQVLDFLTRNDERSKRIESDIKELQREIKEMYELRALISGYLNALRDSSSTQWSSPGYTYPNRISYTTP